MTGQTRHDTLAIQMDGAKSWGSFAAGTNGVYTDDTRCYHRLVAAKWNQFDVNTYVFPFSI